jgi:hypothetical protein
MLARSICVFIIALAALGSPAPFFIDFESPDGRATRV